MHRAWHLLSLSRYTSEGKQQMEKLSDVVDKLTVVLDDSEFDTLLSAVNCNSEEFKMLVRAAKDVVPINQGVFRCVNSICKEHSDVEDFF